MTGFVIANGQLDLSTASTYDMRRGILLEGEWEFVPHTLIAPEDLTARVASVDWKRVQVPGHWNAAFAPNVQAVPKDLRASWRNLGTYRLRLLLPAGADSADALDFALRIGNVHTAYRLFVNGRLLATVGRPGPTAESTVPQFRPLVVPLSSALIAAENEIVFQVAGFHHRNGGLWKPPLLGDRETLEADFAAGVASEWILFGLHLGIAVLFVFLYSGSRRHIELLIFAGLSALIAIRSILTQNRALIQLYPDFDFAWGYRLEYLSFVLIPPLFALLFYSMFAMLHRGVRLCVLANAAIGIALASIIMLTPARVYTQVFAVALAQILFAAILMLLLLFSAVRRGEFEAKLLVIATVIVVAATIHDDLHNRNVIQSVYLATSAFMAFVLFMAGLLSYRVRRVEQDRKNAEARYAARSEFFSMMSHELRTPLHALMGMMQLMEETNLPEPRQLEYMRIMKGGGESLLALVNDILDLSRVEAGKMSFRRESIELRPFLDETISSFRGQARQKNLQLILHLEDRLPKMIAGDAFRIRQIVANLLGNALKFTADGQVELRCLVEDSEAANKRPHIVFDVRDTGAGIPRENQQSIFESFRQADTPASQGPGKAIAGTGLGLAICRQLVEGMGGQIGVESEVGHGSRFWFRLPLIGVDQSAADQTPASESKPGDSETNFDISARILLADDDEISRMLLQRFLYSKNDIDNERTRIEIDAVENGRLAFEKFRDHEEAYYDIVLLDMQMPELNGNEAMQAMRKLEAETNRKKIPAIAVTANAMEDDVQRTREAGFDGFVPKPVNKAELRRVVYSTLLANRSSAS